MKTVRPPPIPVRVVSRMDRGDTGGLKDSLERHSSTRGVGVRGVRGSWGCTPGPWPEMRTLLKSPEPWRTGLSMGGGV